MADNRGTAQKANEGQGLTVIGAQATDDQVKDAVDAADGRLDGDIRRQPDTDAEQALAQYHRDGDQWGLVAAVGRAIFTKGERHIEADDWAPLAAELGPIGIGLVKLLAKVLA